MALLPSLCPLAVVVAWRSVSSPFPTARIQTSTGATKGSLSAALAGRHTPLLGVHYKRPLQQAECQGKCTEHVDTTHTRG